MPDLSRCDELLALLRDHAATTAEVRLAVHELPDSGAVELLPGPELGDRATRVFAWTDELLARVALRDEPGTRPG